MTSVVPQELKRGLKHKYQRINEGFSNVGSSTLLNEIYTELYITEGGVVDVNKEHEVRQIETASSWRAETQETPIKCNDIFKPLPKQDISIRTVLTKGIAGIGKTVSVQKFILDWAEGKANQDVHYIFPIPFRELNLMSNREYNFQNNEILYDVRKSASVDVLLTNLIKGNLFPSALLWITSRPAAANHIPCDYVDQVTEYFKKRISDQSLANQIISHVKSSRSLYIMCHIPVFCWISATVLQRMLCEIKSAEIPKTLTQMFTHFLIFQTKLKTQKYDGKYDVHLYQAKNSILSLGKLAYQQLEMGNLIFYEKDLRECGIDVREASVYSGVCTQIFREEFELYLGKVFSFLHLSIQEFLAALFKFISFVEDKEQKLTITDLLKMEVDRALQSKNGHLDLYLRFLLGLSLKSNHTFLQDLFTQTDSSSNNKQEVADYIKTKIRDNPIPEKSINLFHCLNELNDQSLVQEIQSYLSRRGINRLSGQSLSPAQWSALVFVLLNSEKDLDEFKLNKYEQSVECLLKLLP
ncbi:hypothetical protein M9458_047050, partial [Cirrhinus mrigala]